MKVRRINVCPQQFGIAGAEPKSDCKRMDARRLGTRAEDLETITRLLAKKPFRHLTPR
jgi:hypothetical protein